MSTIMCLTTSLSLVLSPYSIVCVCKETNNKDKYINRSRDLHKSHKDLEIISHPKWFHLS